MPVLRRKRRQSNLGLQTVEAGLFAFLDTFSVTPGQTEVGMVVATAEYTQDSAAIDDVLLYCKDIGTGNFGLTAPTSWSVAPNPGVGPEISFIFGVEADTTAPSWLLFPQNWQGIRSASGATVTGVENMGTGSTDKYLAAVQPAS